MVVHAVAEVVDIPTGTDLIQAVITTPVATPMGMKTYGLDIVVKFGIFLSLARSGILVGLDLILITLQVSLQARLLPLNLSHTVLKIMY